MSAKSRSFCVQLGQENCLLYGVARYPLFRGCLSIEVIEGQFGLSELYIKLLLLSAVEGCPAVGPLSGVPL